MRSLTEFALRHPKQTVALLLLVTAVMAMGAPRANVVVGYRAFLGDDHPTVQLLDQFIERFGGGLPIVVLYTCEGTSICDSVFDPQALSMAHEVVTTLRPMDGVLAVESPATSPVLAPAEDGFALRRFVENGTPSADRDQLIALALADPLWEGSLVSKDGRTGAIVVQLTSSQSDRSLKVLRSIQETLKPFEAKGFTYYLLGDPVKMMFSGADLEADMQRIIPVMVLLIGVVIFFLFGTWQSVFAGLGSVGVAVLWTMGTMGWLGWAKNEYTNVVLPLTLIVGICAAIYILARYAAERQRFDVLTEADRRRLLAQVSGDIGSACVMAWVTTAAGLLSFATSGLTTFIQFGVLCTIGIFAALLLAFTLLPILLVWLPAERKQAQKTSIAWASALELIIKGVERRSTIVIGACIAIFAVCTFGVFRLQVDVDDYKLLGERSRIVQAARFAETHMRKSDSLEIELVVPANRDLQDPSILGEITAFSDFLAGLEGLARPRSIVDVLGRVNRVLHGDDPAYDRPGDNAAANGDLFFLLSMDESQIARNWVSLDHRRVRVSVEASNEPITRRNEIFAKVDEYLQPMRDSGWDATYTGPLAVYRDMIEALQDTQRYSFVTAAFVIFVLASFFLRSVPLGLAAIFLTMLPVVAVLGTMGLWGIYLDVGTAMVGAIVMGIAVDDNIHVLSQYKRRRLPGVSRSEAVLGAVRHVGRAVVTTSVALSLGFFALTVATWQSIASFGFLSGIAILAALVAVLFVLPALITGSGRGLAPVQERAPAETGVTTRRRVMFSALATGPIAAALLIAAVYSMRGGTLAHLPCPVLPSGMVASVVQMRGNCPLEPYDRIVTVELAGERKNLTDLALLDRAIATEDPVHLLVERGELEQWIEVPVQHITRAERIGRFAAALLLSAVILTIALIILWNSASAAAMPFLIFYATVTVWIVCFLGAPVSRELLLAGSFSMAILPASLAHLAMTFPREREIVKRIPTVQAIPYVFSALLIVLASAGVRGNDAVWMMTDRLLPILAIGAWASLVVGCILAYRESTSSVERARARVLLLGTILISILPVALALSSSETSGNSLSTVILGLVIFPLPVGYATIRYQLFDLDIDMRRAIAYLLYGTVLAGGLTGVAALSHSTLATPIPFGSPGFFFSTALVGILIAEPLRATLWTAIQTRISPWSDRLRKLAAEHAQRMSELRDGDESARILGETLERGQRMKWISIYLATEHGWRPTYVAGAEAPLRVALADAARGLVGSNDFVHLARDEDATSPEAAVLRKAGVEVVVPLQSGERLAGIVLLGPSRRSLPYTSVELDFVRQVTAQAAVAIDNGRLADELLASERLSTVGRVAMGLAHELGKPLRVVEDLARRLPDRLNDARLAERDARTIGSISEELLSTLYGFVDNARRAEAAQRRRAPLDEVIDRAVRSMSRLHGTNRVTLSLPPGLPEVSDHENLSRVLTNLLDNAILAGKSGDTVHLYSTMEGDQLRIEVVDQGCGMSSDVAERAFDLFFTTRGDSGGSGIGLAISREIIHGLGGRLSLTPNQPRGTRATIEIPIESVLGNPDAD